MLDYFHKALSPWSKLLYPEENLCSIPLCLVLQYISQAASIPEEPTAIASGPMALSISMVLISLKELCKHQLISP